MLAAHWQSVFADKPTDEGSLDIFRGLMPRLPADIRWERTIRELEELLQRLNNSAPGPDGIPYAAWAATVVAGTDTAVRIKELRDMTPGYPLPGY